MIFVGYQGIGKSSLANKDNNFIDLESSSFWVNINGINVRDENWYKVYAKLAYDLSNQGFHVFTSSHNDVINELKILNADMCIIYPFKLLKTYWIEKLKDRYNITRLEKDYKALKNAEDRYFTCIEKLSNEPCDKIMIKSIKYNLEELINNYLTNKK